MDKIPYLMTILMSLFISLILNAQQPNVVLVVTDDQGYGDLSCHGNPVLKTPNIDKLYEESVRFTDFHVDPTCAPTRGALITGKYSHGVGVWHTVCGGNHLRVSEITMAELFQTSGYRTGLFGKWHLGSNYPYRPIDRGFDEWLGQGDGGTGTTDDWFTNDRVNDYYWYNGVREQRNGYAPDVFFDEAIEFIENEEQAETPFFVYLATYLPHDPHTIPDTAMIDQYKSEVSGYVNYFFTGIDYIDKNIGRLRKVLEETGKAENTIFIFMTDNGGTAGVKLFNSGMRGHKGQVYDGGHRVPFFIHWPKGNLSHGHDVNDLTAHIDVLPTLIDLCELHQKNEINFEGRSFRSQLTNPHRNLPERTLFVETQRTFKPEHWKNTVGMTNKWRLVDNQELYDIQNDPGQTTNVIEKYPEIVSAITRAHNIYWQHVTPGDREIPRFILGHPDDPEIFLSSSDWHIEDVPWNHAQVAKGSPIIGSWSLNVANEGRYRFEVSRWPREANAAIRGIPTFTKTIDSWNVRGEVDKLIYGDEMKSLPVHSIKLEVGSLTDTLQVNEYDKSVVFNIPLKVGNLTVKGSMLDHNGELIAGTYYVYISQL